MKDFLKAFKIILFLAFIIISKEDLCPENKISINALGTTCVEIEDVLENNELSIESDNLLYLASNNQGLIEKDNYKLQIFKLNDEKLQSQNIQKSNIYISKSCMEAMEKEETIKLDASKGIIILVYNYNLINQHNLPEIFFVIRHDTQNSQTKYMNSKTFDFSLCHDDPILLDQQINITNLRYDIYDDNIPIDTDKILYAKKYKIDLFDPHSPFLTDICFKFTSEFKTDVTLDSRLEDYYQKIILCNETLRSHYMGFNYSITDKKFTYRCAYGFYENEEEKDSYIKNINEIDDKMKTIFSTSNLKVITCFKELLNIKNIKNNYGGILCVIVFIIQIILYIDYCCRGAKPLEKKIKDMFDEADKNDKNETEKNKIVEDNNNININQVNTEDRLKKNNNINNNNILETNNNENNLIDDDNNIDINDIQKEKDEDNINVNVMKKKNKKRIKKSTRKEIANPKKKNKTIKPIFNVEKKSDENENGNIDINIERKKDKKKTNLPDNKENKKENKKEKEQEVKSEKHIYKLNDEEKNGLSYERALRHDKRNFCQYYGFMLQISHIIVNVFCRCSDYNLFSIKLGLLFMLFPINITFNSFFFTNKTIKATYVKKIDDISQFAENLVNTFIASIFSSIVLILLKMLCLTNSSVMSLRKIRNVEKARQKSAWTLKCIKIRIFLYYLLSFIFLIIFGYYVACFCTIFENTQINLIKSMFTSWALSLVYPFAICFITSIFRISALRCKKKCLYRINQLLQMI